MKISELSKYIASSAQSPIIEDPLWNNVILLLRLDKHTNTYGLPFYRDYSKYQYHIRFREGSDTSNSSIIRTIDNLDDTDNPYIPISSSVNVPSYTYLPNAANRNARINEINAELLNEINPAYLDSRLNGNPSFELGNSDFTLELSFYVDDVNLPWKYQTLFSVGHCLYMNWTQPEIVTSSQIANLYSFPQFSANTGYGLFIEGNKLKFFAKNTAYSIYSPSILPDTWYHIAIQRQDNILKTFVNGVLETTFSFNHNLTITYTGHEKDPLYKTLIIGATLPFSSFNDIYGIYGRQTETAFSGGLSNIRFTKSARYLSSFYTVTLPHPIVSSANKIDPLFSNVLFHMPCSYDYYDYSLKGAHIQNRQLLKNIPKIASHSLHLDGNTYPSKNINVGLNSSNWCLEFSIIPYVNNIPLHLVNSPVVTEPSTFYNVIAERDWKELLFNQFGLALTYGNEIDETIPLIRLTTAGKKKLVDVDMRIRHNQTFNQQNNQGIYFSTKVSSNGEDWITFPSEVDVPFTTNPLINLPNNEIKFSANFTNNYDNIERDTSKVKGAYSQTRYHIAVQKTNQSLYFFVNGVLNKTLNINSSLYNENNLEIWLGGDYSPLIGRRYVYEDNGTNVQNTNFSITLGLSGIRLTNASRYSISQINDIDYENSIQPLSLSTTALSPSRARVVDIIRESSSNIVSTQTVSWFVFVNQDIDNLTQSKFTLTSLEGLTGASITGLTRLNTFQYRLTADVGTGNGTLTPNFNDDSSVLYADTAVPISYYPGELSISGETYFINKTRPSALLESGTNPYINSKFLVYLTFDAPIAVFNVNNIGLENAAITKYRRMSQSESRYELEITPLQQGVINIKALEATGVSDTALVSFPSNTLTRVFQPHFPILQLPFNVGTRFSDISPSRVLLQEVIANNTLFSTSEYPFGESSSLQVDGLNEQGGFSLPNFNAVSGTLNVDNNIDWTIEFFLRINSTISGTSRRAHILSIENSLGLSISASQGKLLIGRNPAQLTNLFNTVNFSDRATSSFIEWDNNAFTQQEKFPHFAISKKGDIYRFYINGKRIGISKTSTLFNITRGKLNIGYYPVNVNDVPYLLSNLRITYGKALYTTYEINVPYPPYELIPNIADYAEILNYISIYSNNNNVSVAQEGDVVTLKFSSIVPLPINPVVSIAGQSASIAKTGNNYIAEHIITSSDLDGFCEFTITIPAQLGIESKIFTSSTNNSRVTIDTLPLSVQIASDSPNDNNYIVPIKILFSEDILSFNIEDIICSNGQVSNLYKIPNENSYTCTLTGLSTGVISAIINANTIQDTAGNFNLVSNTFTRNVIVPAYIPDPYWNNVTFLLQPTSLIQDISQTNSVINNNGVIVSSNTSPAGLNTSLYFDGNSSLSIISDSLSSNNPYTIELFLYSNSLTSLRLNPPALYPASNITANGFELNWEAIPNVEYLLSIAKDAQFNQPLSGYRDAYMGSSNSHRLDSNTSSQSPLLSSTVAISSKGFIIKWDDITEDTLSYKLDISRNSNFTDKLALYQDKTIDSRYAIVGDIESSEIENFSSTNSSPTSALNLSNQPSRSGHIITGILKDGNDFPQLDYFLEENSVRLYGNDKYQSSAIAEDVELFKWVHIAIVNSDRYTYLYMDGELVDRIKNTGFTSDLVLGHSLGYFNGYMTGIRITKGISRYKGMSYTIPTLPYSTS